jgi:predicted enzyme related to lactoylglutathione lyase
MSNAAHHLRIDYIEFPATNLPDTQQFYSTVFGWKFEDYGPEYTSFQDGRLTGGFFRTGTPVTAAGPLVVIYSANLESTLTAVQAAGGKVVKGIFSFPGGRRFHFTDPSGNQLAVWSDLGQS